MDALASNLQNLPLSKVRNQPWEHHQETEKAFDDNETNSIPGHHLFCWIHFNTWKTKHKKNGAEGKVQALLLLLWKVYQLRSRCIYMIKLVDNIMYKIKYSI